MLWLQCEAEASREDVQEGSNQVEIILEYPRENTRTLKTVALNPVWKSSLIVGTQQLPCSQPQSYYTAEQALAAMFLLG